MYREAVLKIYYQQRGAIIGAEQGKFFYLNNKAIYLADMSQAKIMRNYNGYAIAKQIIVAFSKAKVRPTIIYRRLDLNVLYYTTISKFTSTGIFINYGGHEQWVLPLRYWEVKQGNISDPHKLPVLTLSQWLKSELKEKEVRQDPLFNLSNEVAQKQRFYRNYSFL